MKPDNLPLTHFSQLEKDFKAEVTAAEMLELGIPPDRIVILMLGAMQRSLRKDIQSIEEELSAYDHAEYVVIKTPREGFYDMLPEGMFHYPSANRSADSAKEINKAIKRRKEEELQARRFFIPFEAAINHLRMQMAFYENRLDKRAQYDELVNIFTPYWEIFHYLDPRQANLFLHLLPIIHEIRDNHPVVETVLEMMLQLPVKVQLRNQLPQHPEAALFSTMGNSVLGVNFTTSPEMYSEGVDEILITVGPVESAVFQQFLPDGEKQKLLEMLIDHLLPVHMDIVTEFELVGQDREMRFANEENYLNSVLGADTYL